MSGVTLVCSKAVNVHGYYQRELEARGFKNVRFTATEKDGLNLLINEVNPNLLIVSSFFYEGGTPFMLGGLHERFPDLNIAAVSLHDYPLSLAPWIIFHGVNSYLSFWEGDEEFFKGLQIIKEGKKYISPLVQKIVDQFPDLVEVKNKTTERLHQCLVMLCCGLDMETIGKNLHISERTVCKHIQFLYSTFHVTKREEMVAIAWRLDLVTKYDIRFYDRKRDRNKMPEWAETQININRSIYDY